MYYPIPSLLPILAHNGSVITISSDSNLHAGTHGCRTIFPLLTSKKSNFDFTESSVSFCSMILGLQEPWRI